MRNNGILLTPMAGKLFPNWMAIERMVPFSPFLTS